MFTRILRFFLLASLLTTVACTGLPANVKPVEGFELSRYLGKWYEIARLDHSFERGLDQVSAEYSLREDGSVKVVNRGYSQEKGEWKQAVGKAYFVGDKQTGHLKVSFFGPFYSSYIVFELDQENYQYAFIAGPNHDYLWLLSRSPKVSPALLQKFKALASQRGFDLSELIDVKQ